jgi:hypothetical protein
MMQNVEIQGTCLTALLDFGSTHNFIKTAAARGGTKLCSRAGLRVAVANGDRVTSSGALQGPQILGQRRVVRDQLLWPCSRLLQHGVGGAVA